MRRTFLGTVTAINPAETSGLLPWCYVVAVDVNPEGTARPTFTTTFHFPHEETRDLGALFGKSNAVRITVSTDTEANRVPTWDDAKPGEHYANNCTVYLRRSGYDSGDERIAEIYGADSGDSTSDGRARRIAALLNGAQPTADHPAVALLRELVAFANNPKTGSDHEGAVNWLLDFAERSDVVAIVGGEPT